VSALASGLALALLASVALNGSYLLQHVGARHAPAVTPRHPLRTLRGLLRSRAWAAGLAAGLLGWALHVDALLRAPLSLVQAFAVGGLVLAVPAGTRVLRERLSRKELAAIALMVAALALLAVGAQPAAAQRVPGGALAAYLGGAALLAAGLARRATPALLGAAAGVLYGAGDAATKAATIAARHSLLHALLGPWPAAVALLSAGAFFCFQRGLQTGAAVPVIALMTAMTNAVAILGGLLVFGDPLARTSPLALPHALALLAIGLAAWRLAPSQARLTVGAAKPEPAAPSAAGLAVR
jgi:hypothetical protein